MPIPSMLNLMQAEMGCAAPEMSDSLASAPLSALGFRSRELLSRGLDTHRVLPSPQGLPRDYRGLAEACGVSVPAVGSRQPTLSVLAEWGGANPSPTIGDLLVVLSTLDRHDVVADLAPVVSADALDYALRLKQMSLPLTAAPRSQNILTYDDADLSRVGLPPGQRYDAYLLYAEQDMHIAKDIVYRLENQYHLKICVRDRDVMPGAGFEHEAITYLITERCNRIIVVFTPNFVDSPADKFIYNYSVALGLSEGRSKIVPCLFGPKNDAEALIKLRRISYSLVPVNFTRENPFTSNWDLLSRAVSVAPVVREMRAIEEAPRITEVPSQPESSKSSKIEVPVPPPRFKQRSKPIESRNNPSQLSGTSSEPRSNKSSDPQITGLISKFKTTKLGSAFEGIFKGKIKTKKKKTPVALPS